MASTGSAPPVRYSYPLHAILVVALVWVVFLGLIAVYTTVAIALFPISPFVAIAGAGLVGMAHQYAISVRTPIKS